MKVNQITDWVAEIIDFDAANMTTEMKQEVEEAFTRNHVLAFRNQTLTPTQLSEFAKKFGPLEIPINRLYIHPECENVLILSNEIRPDGTAVGLVDGGDGWHSDSSHIRIPSKATILQSIKNPDLGGDTLYCNMELVFTALPRATKDLITGRFGVHNVSKILNPRMTVSANRPDAKEFYENAAKTKPSVLQPLVRTHPVTGKSSVYCSPRFTIAIEGMDDNQAQPLLDELFGYIYDERFQYRHIWSDADLVMWDNRCLNHKATGNLAPGDIRRMHRTVLAGDEAYYQSPVR
ncbi:MAG: TauD/TfdA family dioxygenase [Acidimicrobiaceae bacterium]|nr:TauD/TfdA family dioxygenase [Acidimicrobiaceae bacterium]